MVETNCEICYGLWNHEELHLMQLQNGNLKLICNSCKNFHKMCYYNMKKYLKSAETHTYEEYYEIIKNKKIEKLDECRNCK